MDLQSCMSKVVRSAVTEANTTLKSSLEEGGNVNYGMTKSTREVLSDSFYKLSPSNYSELFHAWMYSYAIFQGPFSVQF